MKSVEFLFLIPGKSWSIPDLFGALAQVLLTWMLPWDSVSQAEVSYYHQAITAVEKENAC